MWNLIIYGKYLKDNIVVLIITCIYRCGEKRNPTLHIDIKVSYMIKMAIMI